jgi:hypothetical protein
MRCPDDVAPKGAPYRAKRIAGGIPDQHYAVNYK